MITLSTDYTGRTVDLEVFQTEAVPSQLLKLSLTATDGNAHRRVTGMQKLVQRYLLALLTPKGSVKYYPDRGTDLMLAAAAGLFQGRSDIVQYFGLANSDAAAQLKAADASVEGASAPDDEKYAKSWLMDYLIDQTGTRLYLKVRLLSQAGEDFTFIIPAT
jgi:hypothetical protein